MTDESQTAPPVRCSDLLGVMALCLAESFSASPKYRPLVCHGLPDSHPRWRGGFYPVQQLDGDQSIPEWEVRQSPERRVVEALIEQELERFEPPQEQEWWQAE